MSIGHSLVSGKAVAHPDHSPHKNAKHAGSTPMPQDWMALLAAVFATQAGGTEPVLSDGAAAPDTDAAEVGTPKLTSLSADVRDAGSDVVPQIQGATHETPATLHASPPSHPHGVPLTSARAEASRAHSMPSAAEAEGARPVGGASVDNSRDATVRTDDIRKSQSEFSTVFSRQEEHPPEAFRMGGPALLETGVGLPSKSAIQTTDFSATHSVDAMVGPWLPAQSMGGEAGGMAGQSHGQDKPEAFATFMPTATAGEGDVAAPSLMYWNQNGQQQAELNLQMDGQKNLQIELSLRGQETALVFRSDHVDVRDALDTHLAHLKGMLQQEGLSLANVSISAQTDPRNSPHQQPPPGRRKTWLAPAGVSSVLSAAVNEGQGVVQAGTGHRGLDTYV